MIRVTMLRGRLHECLVAVALIWLSSFVASDPVPMPISVQPNKEFHGVDGNWSTFAIRVGNPPQNFAVLASTLVPETWVVASEGCTKDSPGDCMTSRGGLFMSGASKTWNDQKIWSIIAEADLGFSDKIAGKYGYDTIGLSTPEGGVVLDQQIMAGIAAPDFWNGHIGLATWTPENNGNTKGPLLTQLRDRKRIPSLSYGYTAGAYYNATLGSLTLGGQDSKRFVPNSVPFSFGADSKKILTVGVQAINYKSGSDTKNLAPAGFYALIDSTIAQLWLPKEACEAFKDAYGLEFDDLKLQYTISDEQHQKNVEAKPVATFVLGNLQTGGQTVSISFPYEAFNMFFYDPKAQSPKPYRYFPLRQGASQKQFVLGRTFLQEAYLTVDYERKNFSVAQALAGNTDGPSIQAIVSPQDAGTATGADPAATSITVTPGAAGPSFPTGAIAGIVIAVLAVAAGIFAFLFIRRRRRQRSGSLGSNGKNPASDGSPDPEKVEYYGEGAAAAGGKEAVDAPPYTKGGPAKAGVSETIAEMPSPDPQGQGGDTFAPLLGPGGAAYELMGDKPRTHEMDSRHISMASSAGGATVRGAGPSTALDPGSSLAAAAEEESPTAHAAAAAVAGPAPGVSPDLPTPHSETESQWANRTYFEDDPSSPGSRSIVSRATSMGVAQMAGGSARIVSHSPRSGTAPRMPSVRRQDSAGSRSTLVNEDSPSGRASPGAPPAPDSAFQSPRLGFSTAPPRAGSVSPLPGHSRNVSSDQYLPPAVTPP